MPMGLSTGRILATIARGPALQPQPGALDEEPGDSEQILMFDLVRIAPRRRPRRRAPPKPARRVPELRSRA